MVHAQPKTCHTQEYAIEELEAPVKISNKRSFGFQYSFGSASTNGEREQLVKTIKTEQLVLTSFTLVGSVGGWFGLMVGFSFYGLADEIIDASFNLGKKISGMKRAEYVLNDKYILPK